MNYEKQIQEFKASLEQNIAERLEYSNRTNQIKPALSNTHTRIAITDSATTLHTDKGFYTIEYIDEENMKKLRSLIEVNKHGLYMRPDDSGNCVITSLHANVYESFDCLCIVQKRNFDNWFEEQFDVKPDEIVESYKKQISSLNVWQAPKKETMKPTRNLKKAVEDIEIAIDYLQESINEIQDNKLGEADGSLYEAKGLIKKAHEELFKGK